MHFIYTLRKTNTLCSSIFYVKTTGKVICPYFQHECQRNYAKSSKKPGASGGVSSMPPIILPLPDQELKTLPIRKKNIWDNVPGSDKLLHVTDANIEEILKGHKSILIMFYGTWCSVCKDVNMEIAKAAGIINPKEGSLGVCDVMENVLLVDKYIITKTPAMKYFKNGRHVADYVGKASSVDFVEFLKEAPKIL